MEKFGKVIVKLRIPILILSFLLLIPSAIGYFNTRVNYDILYYLPNEIETMLLNPVKSHTQTYTLYCTDDEM